MIIVKQLYQSYNCIVKQLYQPVILNDHCKAVIPKLQLHCKAVILCDHCKAVIPSHMMINVLASNPYCGTS